MRSSFSASERESTSRPSFFTALLLREKSWSMGMIWSRALDLLSGEEAP